MTDRELMQQALEALEEPREHIFRHRRLEAITALRERLAQPEHNWEAEYITQVELHNQTLDELRDALARPEQEPVAWQWLDTGTFRKSLPASAEPGAWTPLYTTPPRREWVGLTDEEARGLAFDWRSGTAIDFARAIEAKLREKNA